MEVPGPEWRAMCGAGLGFAGSPSGPLPHLMTVRRAVLENWVGFRSEGHLGAPSSLGLFHAQQSLKVQGTRGTGCKFWLQG